MFIVSCARNFYTTHDWLPARNFPAATAQDDPFLPQIHPEKQQQKSSDSSQLLVQIKI